MAAFFAFLHHLAAFALVGAVAVELVLLRGELSVASARKLQATDAVLGAAALLLLIVLLRVFLFVLASISPTIEFLSWKTALKQGAVPAVAPAKLRTLRRILHLELAGLVVILLCAALMARGVGHFGT